jgi:DNA-binding transcriptional ArsR family regulator
MEHLAEYFKVFSEPNRLAVLEALRNGPLNVTAVFKLVAQAEKLMIASRRQQLDALAAIL